MGRFLPPDLKSSLSLLNPYREGARAGDDQPCALTERRRTDRRRHLSDFRHREFRLRAVTQAAGLGVYDLDSASGSNYWSAELKAIAGLVGEAGEIPLEQMAEVLHPDDRDRVLRQIADSLDPKSSGVLMDEYRLLRPDGSVRWVKIQGHSFFMGRGQDRRLLGASGVVIDITEHKQAQASLEETRSRLEAVLDSLNEGVVIFDLDGQVLNTNPEARRIMGYRTPAEARRRLPEFTDTFELLSLDGRSLPLEEWPIGQVLRGASFFDYEIILLDKRSGSRRIISHNGTPVRRSGGEIILGVLTLRDVTNRKQEEEALVRERSRLQAILDHSPVLILIRDLEGRIVLANHFFLETVDVPAPGGIAGRSLFDIFPQPLAEQLSANDSEALARDAPVRSENDICHRDGSWHRYLTLQFPIHDVHTGAYRSLCSISIDITELKVAEARIRELNAELESRVQERTAELQRANEALLQSNAELRHFAHATAHDLQTPLRSIAGFAQLLREEVQGDGNEQVHAWSSAVVENTKRLQILIQELLAYTRLDMEGLPFEAVDFQKLFGEVRDSLAVLIAETGAQISCGALPTVWADRTQLAQVLQNLIENGIKYNQSKSPTVSVSCDFQDDRWVFSVADNGIGIDPKHHERIFEIFRRLHAYHQIPGTGIGLALCRRILERHGGHIWVNSEPGHGSTFYFSLPVPEEGGSH